VLDSTTYSTNKGLMCRIILHVVTVIVLGLLVGKLRGLLNIGVAVLAFLFILEIAVLNKLVGDEVK